MLKLIVTDMDNTLILPDKTMPKEIFPLIATLRQKGIRFAAASARHYDVLYRMFEDAAGLMGFICDNGAYGEIDSQPFEGKPLSQEELALIISVCKKIPGTHLSLSARNAMYYRGEPAKHDNEVTLSVNSLYHKCYISDLRDVPEAVFRATLYDPAGALTHSLPVLKEALGNCMSVTATDYVCVDVMKTGVNKGTGLAALQRHLQVKPEETMAFGDYYNDIEMLDLAYYSYAVENAEEEVKKHCRFLTKSNAQRGVITAIASYLKENKL